MSSILKIQAVNPTGETLLFTTRNRYNSLDGTTKLLAVKVTDTQVINLSSSDRSGYTGVIICAILRGHRPALYRAA
jgi:hypothetical protein